MFYVGQKIVCVDAGGTNTIGIRELEEGAIYTVSALENSYQVTAGRYGSHLDCLRLVESSRPPNAPPFAVQRFRPVVTTDISIFTDMFKSVPAEYERIQAERVS